MDKRFLFDLDCIVEKIKCDLEESGELIRLPHSGEEMTYEKLLDRLDGPHDITDRDVIGLDEIIYELAKEFVFYRLMHKYLSIPSEYGALYNSLLDTLFVGDVKDTRLPLRERQKQFCFDRPGAIGSNVLVYAEAYIDDQLRIMPPDEWTMIDFDVSGDIIIVTTGENFKDFYFNAMFGNRRWTGDYIPAGSSPDKLRDEAGRKVNDATIFNTVARSLGGSRRRLNKETNGKLQSVEAVINAIRNR